LDQGGFVICLDLVESMNIRKLLKMNWEFCFYRSCRKSNVCADALVSMTCENGSSFILYKQCPARVSLLF